MSDAWKNSQFSRHHSYFTQDIQILLAVNIGQIRSPHPAQSQEAINLAKMKTATEQNMSCVMRKPMICIYENKDPDQFCGNREADHRLCFRYIDSTISLLSISEISSL